MTTLIHEWDMIGKHANAMLHNIIALHDLAGSSDRTEYALIRFHSYIRGFLHSIAEHVAIDESIRGDLARFERRAEQVLNALGVGENVAIRHKVWGRHLHTIFNETRDEKKYLHRRAEEIYKKFIEKRIFRHSRFQELQALVMLHSKDSKKAHAKMKELAHHLNSLFRELHKGEAVAESIVRDLDEMREMLEKGEMDRNTAQNILEKIGTPRHL